jgi:hypothetical protein
MSIEDRMKVAAPVSTIGDNEQPDVDLFADVPEAYWDDQVSYAFDGEFIANIQSSDDLF